MDHKIPNAVLAILGLGIVGLGIWFGFLSFSDANQSGRMIGFIFMLPVVILLLFTGILTMRRGVKGFKASHYGAQKSIFFICIPAASFLAFMWLTLTIVRSLTGLAGPLLFVFIGVPSLYVISIFLILSLMTEREDLYKATGYLTLWTSIAGVLLIGALIHLPSLLNLIYTLTE